MSTENDRHEYRVYAHGFGVMHGVEMTAVMEHGCIVELRSDDGRVWRATGRQRGWRNGRNMVRSVQKVA